MNTSRAAPPLPPPEQPPRSAREPLPAPAQLLADWRAYGLPFRRCPRLLGALPGGRSNASYLVEADGARVVLRLDGVGAALATDRARELRYLVAAGARGLAPPVVFADAARGILVTAHVAGEHCVPATLDDTRLGALLALLEAVHALDIDDGPTDYRALAAHYRAGTATAAQDCPDTLDEHLGLLEALARRGPCHHDPVPANVLFTASRPLLLDWEYAGRGFAL
ncbi:MAG: phosphotransferase, partial [Gammaproteobacteria bacterium]